MEQIKRPDTLPPPPRTSPSNRRVGENALLKAEKEPKPETAQEYLQELVLGKEGQAGILTRITEAETREQLRSLKGELINILYDSQALTVLGHPDATRGNELYKAALSRYRDQEGAIVSATGDTSSSSRDPSTVEERSSRVMDVLNRFLAVHTDTESLTDSPRPLSIAQYKAVRTQGKELKDELGLMPNRILVARLLSYTSRHGQIADSLPEKDTTTLGVELNDPGMPVMAEWEFVERLPGCDDETFASLEQRYAVLTKRGDEICKTFDRASVRQLPTWYRAFEEFENDWLAFYIDRLGKVRL